LVTALATALVAALVIALAAVSLITTIYKTASPLVQQWPLLNW
jgi:hypothetical protein